MKKLHLLFIASVLSFFNMNAQQVVSLDYFDVNIPKVDERDSSLAFTRFDKMFESDDAKNDFKKLRDYRQGILNDIASIDNVLQFQLNEITYQFDRNRSNINRALSQLEIALPADTISFRKMWDDMYVQITAKTATTYLEKVKGQFEVKEKEYKDLLNKVTKKRALLNQDLEATNQAIDNALTPERARQSHKITMTGMFGIMVGLVILVFFVVIYLRSGNEISTTLLSDGGLQFVTLFVLIIAIILFGVLGILEGKELAAIISGIAGYILGRNAKVGPNPQNNPVPASTSTPAGSDTQSSPADK